MTIFMITVTAAVSFVFIVVVSMILSALLEIRKEDKENKAKQ